MNKLCAAAGGAMFLLLGCSSHKPEDYAAEGPKLDIRQYLNGELEAWGTFTDWKGKVTRRFHVAMLGEWKGNDGTLKEHFTYDDGEQQDRLWHFKFTDDKHFTGTAADVVGTGYGVQDGFTVNMQYTLTVPVKDKSYDLAMDDWLYLINDKQLINRTVMKKFGVTVGTLTIAFAKK